MTYQVELNGIVKTIEDTVTFGMLAEEVKDQYSGTIVLAKFNGELKELFRKVENNGTVSFVTLHDETGVRTYRRTGIFIMEKAFRDLHPSSDRTVRVLFSMDQAYYCEAFENDEKVPLDADFIEKLAQRMREIVDEDIKLDKFSVNLQKALEIFGKTGMPDKQRLFRYRRASNVNIYDMDGYQEYFYGYMLPSTGYFKQFSLQEKDGGFFLNYPSQQSESEVDLFEFQPKIFEEMLRGSIWARDIGVATLGALNDRVTSGSMQDLILMSEVDQERRVEEIADAIVQQGKVKVVLIAGPSSSGKTTFSHRLSIELMAKGKRPHPIAMDDFFLNRSDMIPRPDGTLDFEALDAVDLTEFRRVISGLMDGQEMNMPTFDFKEGKRTYKGNKLQISENDILIIEGIHGLNPAVAEGLEEDSIFRVYISALTCLKIDEHNCLSTRDSRLMRRMVRDARTRGSSAHYTLQQWNSVRRGEESHIFPYQENADAVFNSSLIYEISVLKIYVEPLLFAVPKESPEYYEAKRLLKLLDYCMAFPVDGIAHSSIIREFVGGSCFNV